ncbi:MAG: HigA family addiction module antidote protein [Proteobacteria bacterium]|nr:HigA family addiction module antidote protein [Pseudomonadota bacterium]
MAKLLAPVTPGEILKEDFMLDHKLSINKLAREIAVPPNRILEIVRGKRAITADTALRLGRYFGTGPELWLNLQTSYELEVARRKIGREIEARIVPIKSAA